MNAHCKQMSLSLAFILASTAASAADLTVRFPELKSAEGQVRVAVFSSAQDFPKKMLRGEAVNASASPVAVTFKDLPPGRYAVSAFHDLNANGKLETGAMGRPTEPTGFSRDARGMFGPPPFADAAFDLEDPATTIEIKLK